MLGFRTTEDSYPGMILGETRELTSADLAMVGSIDVGSAASPLKELKARHHAVAKALADGMRPNIVAATYGYSLSRISILANDPSFKELIEHYKADAHYEGAAMRQRLVALGVDAVDEMAKRLEEEPGEIGFGTLLKVAEFAADRTGFGKKTETEVNVNVGFADRLKQARERVAAQSAKMIDITPGLRAATEAS